MRRLGGICSAPKVSRETLCHMQTFSPDFTSLLSPFNIPSRPFSRKSRTSLHGLAQMCSRPPFSPGISMLAHLQDAPSPLPASGVPWGCSERAQPHSPRLQPSTGMRGNACPAREPHPGGSWGCPAVAPGLRDAPELPRVPGRGSPKDANRGRGRPDTPQPGQANGDCHPPLRAVCKCPDTSFQPPHSPGRNPACLSLLSHPCPGELHPLPELSSSPGACAGNLGGDTSENSRRGSKEAVPRPRGSPESSL